jgi:predicted adenine nucleotide alpha hydrolase (AANH) superfamily ATPase
MSLLLHICCGPCATATVPHWREQGHEVVGFFHNPNIHPLLEFRRRLTGSRDLAAQLGFELTEDLEYDPSAWFARVGAQGADRCVACIAQRLDRAGSEAAARGCEAFSTSLSISPWQDHDAIMAGGAAAAERHGVEFLYHDLRPLYRESRRLSREAGLYRQAYCGCILSEWERYRDRPGAAIPSTDSAGSTCG